MFMIIDYHYQLPHCIHLQSIKNINRKDHVFILTVLEKTPANSIKATIIKLLFLMDRQCTLHNDRLLEQILHSKLSVLVKHDVVSICIAIKIHWNRLWSRATSTNKTWINLQHIVHYAIKLFWLIKSFFEQKHYRNTGHTAKKNLTRIGCNDQV